MSDEKKHVSELLKKVVGLGATAAFLTEETIRKNFSDLPLSKDLLNSLLKGAVKSRTEFLKGLMGEFRNYLGKIDLSSEVSNLVENYNIKIEAELSFNRKKPQGPQKKTKKKSQVKTQRK